VSPQASRYERGRISLGRRLAARAQLLAGDRSGVTAALFALSLPVLLGSVGLAVDGSLMYVAQNRLQVAADAAALAGAQYLNDGVDAAQAKAIDLATANIDGTGSSSPVLSGSDIEAGTWDAAARTFTPGTPSPNALRVTTRFAEANGNPHRLLFGAFLGRAQLDLEATAIALGTGGPTCPGNVVLYPDTTFTPQPNERRITTLGEACGADCPAGFSGSAGYLMTPEGHPIIRLTVGPLAFAANPTTTLTIRSGSTINDSYTLPGPGRFFVAVKSFTNPYDINDPATRFLPKTSLVWSNFGAGTATWSNNIRRIWVPPVAPVCPPTSTGGGSSSGGSGGGSGGKSILVG
jgi:Flp pilus assembly protein TadG